MNRGFCRCGHKIIAHSGFHGSRNEIDSIDAADEWKDDEEHSIMLPTDSFGELIFENTSGKIAKVCYFKLIHQYL